MLNDDFLYAGTQPTDDDKKLFVTFSLEPRLDKDKSVEEGRNVYRDVEFVTIRIPGDKTLSIHRPVRPSDKQRFPLQYAAFRNNRGEQIVGTPLHLWPGCKPSQVKELEYFNVRTVEQLATMPDGAGGASMMGIQALRNAAKQYVKGAKEQAPLLAVQKELADRDATIAALTERASQNEAQLAAILARLGSEPAKEPKKGK